MTEFGIYRTLGLVALAVAAVCVGLVAMVSWLTYRKPGKGGDE